MRLWLEAHVAQPVHHHTHVRIQVTEEWVLDKEGGIQCVRQLALQGVRQVLQDRDAFPLDQFGLLQEFMLQILLDAVRELRAYGTLPQIPAQEPELLHVLCLHVPQTGHRARYACHYRGEGDHCKEEHDDGKCTLPDVPGADVHGCGRELRQAPVQGGQVFVLRRVILNAGNLNPVDDAILQTEPANEVPCASYDVVQDENRHQQLCQVDDDERVLVLDQVVEQVDYPLELQQSQEPQGPHSPGALHDLAQLADLPLIAARQALAGHSHEPLWADNDEVRDEPCGEVVLEDPPVVRDVQALVKVT
mmetsp:Transcript_71759/g.214275  ORF Transcript_71759/g.214275 Transcript_71759/m.214275 type:complete len:305 (-) Transcript_71759:897-1811(-)